MHRGFGPEHGSPAIPAKRGASHALAYRADVDGLRAIAILSVVFFHAELGILSGGFVGVDVFFVISGFLISRIVLKEAGAGTFSLLNFYKRRTLRIFPALFTVIAACFLAGWFLFPPQEYKNFSNSAIAAAAFYSNFYFDSSSDYFAAESVTMPLLHTWSLAVEEQFYVLAPGLLLLAVRFPRFAKAGFLLLFAASLAVSVVLLGKDASKAFYMLPSRAFELMVGTALAMGLVPAIRNRALAEAAGLAGLALIAFAALAYSEETAFPGVAALVPCLGAALIIHSGRHAATATARLLSTAPMVFVGKVSYSFYLWHWPFLVFAISHYGTEIGVPARLALIAGAFLASILSYHVVEQPARVKGAAMEGRKVLLLGVIAILVVVTQRPFVAGSIVNSWRLSPEAAAFVAENPVRLSKSIPCRDNTWSNTFVGLHKTPHDCAIGVPEATPHFLLFGDSHAQAIARQVAILARQAGIAGQTLTSAGCPPVRGLNEQQARTFAKCATEFAVLDQYLADPAIRTVVIASRWAIYMTGRPMPNEKNRHRLFAEAGENAAAFEALVTDTVRKIRESGKHVVLLGPIPELGFNLPAQITKALMRGRPADFTLPREAFDERQKDVLPFLARLDAIDGVDVLYPHEILCDAVRCRTMLDDKALYVDDDHLSPAGAALLSPMLTKAMAAR